MSATVAVTAPAKINLWLRVFGRDAKGYHAIETLYQLISLADELTVEVRADEAVMLEGAPKELGDPKQNLVVRAAEAYRKAAQIREGARITLRKRIPWNAGLGGGSSDAAAVLTALNGLHGGRLPASELVEVGASLGSDVPFFLSGTALAMGWGRGERLLTLPPLPSRPFLIVPPAAPVRTADAYSWIDQDRRTEHTGEFAAVLPVSSLGSWESVRRASHNDFEPVIAARMPEIGHLLDRVRGTDAFLVRLAGSGGAIVALYESERARDVAWAHLGGDESILRGGTLEEVPSFTFEHAR